MRAQLIVLPKIADLRGNLTFIQNPQQIPFEIKRVFWTYDVAGGQTRGGHAFRTQLEVIIALSGSFDVVVTYPDGTNERYQLNRSYHGLFIPSMLWRHMENYSTNSLSLHISNQQYDSGDYIRDFQVYSSHA